ncbi:hypothetical protein SAMN04487898_103323 [Pedobacter sp. ok626]|uniref:hypothetical protein n=1 Tax=Pedobacter sp. ok626 TaxID=1761882 RepID=UPI00088B2A17|nr:hypothetical protein [Pedobacter sp. ok626]SDJ58518.1 hypothetical protein SAMN04487898_103323 [Pedobacter sp. ok626]
MNYKNVLPTLISCLLLVVGAKAQQTDELSFLYRSELSKWTRKIPTDNYYDIESGLTTGKYVTGAMGLADLYNVAYFGKSRWGDQDELYANVYKWPMLRSTSFEPFNTDSTTLKGFYNYSLEVPKERRNKAYMQFAMQCDLKKYFGYKVEEERMNMACWMMSITEQAARNLKSKVAKSSAKGNEAGFSFKKVKMAKVVQQILSYQQNGDPILDMTGLPYEIDLTIKADMTDIEALRKVLVQQGILLTKVQKLMTILVISDPESNSPIKTE